MTTVRRSARTRHQATSIYDDAKKDLEEKANDAEDRQENDVDTDEEMSIEAEKSDVESEVEEEKEGDANASGESSDEEEDFKPKAPTKSRSASAKKKKQNQKKTQIKIGREPASRKPRTATGGTQTRRGVSSALAALAKKVLEESETPDNSLVAALLQSYKSKNTSSSSSSRAHDKSTTIYTPQLESVARRVIEEHKNDPNKAQVELLNLLFRSVGGSVETNLDPENSILEEMDNEEWAKVVTDLVDEMRHTPADRTLLCADPDGAVHAAAVASNKELDTADAGPSSLGVREYRRIYEEFWYVLGTVALTEGIASNDDADEYEESTEQKRRHTMSFTSTSRFDAEVVRDLILRVTELVTVGQPDVRAAAMIAALQLGHAVLNRTVELGAKLDVATRQFEAASRGKKDSRQSKKAETFRHQMDSLKRTKADLEEIVFSSLVQGVFMNRYRDSNMFTRAAALKSLSRMTIQRPDLFLMDKYLKYFGWMMSDKAASVRVASLDGLHAPFLAQKESSKSRKKIDVRQMENVVSKFLPKIADCVIDSNLVVQEKAMALMLALECEGFLDGVDDDNLWSQVNLRALSPQTTPAVRRDALYFVMDQLEAFDDDEAADENSGQKRKRSKDKASLAESSERLMVQRIEALAYWVGEILVDGPVPIDKIRVHLADYIVQSLREMPEHKALVTNWNTLLRAIGDDSAATTQSGDKGDNRAEVAKQRVLVQMLSRAAQAEVAAVAQDGFMGRDMDPDEAEIEAEENAEATIKPKQTKGKKSKSYSGGMPHEVLSVSLLSALPDLLIKFKGDPTILGSITLLPRYILPSVLSLPQRKQDFLALVKNLSGVYLESSDEYVLQNVALALSSLSQGGHTRTADASLQLQRIASTLSERLIELLAESESKGASSRKKSKKSKKSSKRKRGSDDSLSSDDSDADDDHDLNDVEYAISSCLRRLRVLSKRCDLTELLDGAAADEDSSDNTVGDLCGAIVTGIENRLKVRAVKVETADGDEDEEPDVSIPEIWTEGDKSAHDVVASSVEDALSLLLSITAWKLSVAQQEDSLVLQDDEDITMGDEDDGDDADIDKFGVVRHRDQLFALLVLCFEQFLPPVANPSEQEPLYSKEHIAFADRVQEHACQVAGDLRCLFPKELADATSPFLRACALTDDQSVAGGLVRYLRSKEEHLRILDDGEDDVELANELLLPLARSIAANWKNGNRREAGVALAHVTGSGSEASKLVSSFSRVLKRIDPVRLLEAHMASLRQGYEEWVLDEPEDVQSDRPTDEEMEAFAEAEKKHAEEFHMLEQQAARLSSSLGVVKLSDPKLGPSLLGFVRNGIKFSFSHDDGELVLGSRLSFLTILSKYAGWIRRNTEQRDVLCQDLEDLEADLRADPDFHEVHEDDLKALASFRTALGIKDSTRHETSPRSVAEESGPNIMGDEYSDDEGSDGGDSATRASVGTNRSRRRSHGGASVSSVRSKLSSAPNSLSPLYEEDASVDESPDNEMSPPPAKRRIRGKRESIASTLSASTMGQSQPTIAEGSSESDVDSH